MLVLKIIGAVIAWLAITLIGSMLLALVPGQDDPNVVRVISSMPIVVAIVAGVLVAVVARKFITAPTSPDR